MECDYCIIGGGIAGVSCAENLLLHSKKSIILISASSLLKKAQNISQITERLTAFDVAEVPYHELEKENFRIVIDEVANIDSSSKTVFNKTTASIKYDKLCLCTGARPKVLCTPTSNSFVLSLRDNESVLALQNKLQNSSRVVIIGNGGIASELVHKLESIDILWAIRDDCISANYIDAGAAKFFMDQLNRTESNSSTSHSNCDSRAHKTKSVGTKVVKVTNDSSNDKESQVLGVSVGPNWHSNIILEGSSEKKRLHIESSVIVLAIYTQQEFKDSGKKESKCFKLQRGGDWNVFVEFSNGCIYGCDFVISATGVIPNGDIFPDLQFELNAEGAIVVNERMETSIKDIYGAGDVIAPSWTRPHWFQMRLWSQARQMGHYAAESMIQNGELALDFCFEMFSHVTSFFGYKVILLGLYNAQGLSNKDTETLLRITDSREYVKVILKEGRMQGAILIGDTNYEETFENLILNQMNLNFLGLDLLDPNVDIEDYFD